MTTEEFVEKARKVHGDEYDYSKVEYKNARTKICIICPKHGEFWIIPNSHLHGTRCGKCYGGIKYDTESFIEKAKQKHCNKYDYSKTVYVNSQTKVCIICPKHGEFWQIPSNHLFGHGCPKCNSSSLENAIKEMLEENHIEHIDNNRKILNGLELDFFLPKYNIAIECQGIQHFQPRDFSGHNPQLAEKMFEEIKKRDEQKLSKCQEKGIKLLYYSNLNLDFPYNVYTDLNEILYEITC